MSQKLIVKELIPYRDNSFYFDDITEDSWDSFIQSIKTSGVQEPIVVTQDNVIVSGHQRVRACKALGIEEVDAVVRDFDSEDEILKCMIETNICQRGVGNLNPVKFGRCIKELERIYGVRDGSAGGTGANQYSKEVESNNYTEADLADQLGLTRQTIQNYKALADMIPEIQTLVETGIVTPTTARAIAKKLPEFQQKELAEQLAQDDKKKYSMKEIEEEIKQIKKQLSEKERKINELERDSKEREDYIAELESREPEIKEVEIEVVPDDYEELKKSKESSLRDYRNLESLRAKDQEKIKELQGRLKDLETRKDIDELQKKLEEEAGYFAIRTYDYIQKNGGYVWITERMEQLPERQRKEFINTVYAIDAFAKQMIENIGGYGIG